MANTHPNNIIQFFSYQHLPEHLQRTSKLFHDLAHALEADLASNPEKTVAFRKLLEAKDAAVRAGLYKTPQTEGVHPDTGIPLKPHQNG